TGWVRRGFASCGRHSPRGDSRSSRADQEPLMQNGSSTPNISRVDAADRLIAAPPAVVYRAFAEPGALERWLPPRGMRGEMRVFVFRSGGSYRMRLTYDAPQPGQGKASDDADDVEVRLTRVEPERRVEQEVTFTSEDPAFAGTMR